MSGTVQGVVIGDHNTVTQNFLTRHEAYVAQESRPVPAHWIERAALVAQGASALQAGAVVALCGMGGSGKSSLAARIATMVSSRFAAGCFWIDLAAGDTDEALLRIALAFGHDISSLESREARSRSVRSLMAGKSVLLVLDDAWEKTDLDPFLPLPTSCAALVTTRNDSLASIVATDVMSVEELPEADAVALLASVSGSPAAEPALLAVARAFGGLPMALELAGKLARQQLRRPGFSWQGFAASFGDGKKRLALGLAGSTVRAAFDASWDRALGKDGRRAFSMLGLFLPGGISTAEAAAAWDAKEPQALVFANELIDLSLVRLVDPVTLRLHPLLADYAREMTEKLAPEERDKANCRIADHLYRIARRPPTSLGDMAAVLRSHYHSAAARDGKRAARVYPWFTDGEVNVAVPAFLIDHGQHRTHVFHERLQLQLWEGSSAWTRSFGHYRLGDALADAGDLLEAEKQLQRAVELMESPDVDASDRSIGLAKFLMRLGQVKAASGDLPEAEAMYRRAVELDRQDDASGQVSGAHQNALIGLLQLADLFALPSRREGGDRAQHICRDVRAEAAEHGEPQIEIMALARLARLFQQSDLGQALDLVREAEHVGATNSGVFEGRGGARYARLLAEIATNLAMNDAAALDDALALFCLAVGNAGRCDAQQELGDALYGLGNLFENYHIIGRDAPLAAAWACYALAESYTMQNEAGSPLNAQFRIDQRIVPRIEESQRAAAAAAVKADPWGLIDAALSPRALRWRPEP